MGSLRRLHVLLRWVLDEYPAPEGVVGDGTLERARWLGAQAREAHALLTKGAPIGGALLAIFTRGRTGAGLTRDVEARMRGHGEVIGRTALSLFAGHEAHVTGARVITLAEALAEEATVLGGTSAEAALAVCRTWRKAQAVHARSIEKGQICLGKLKYRDAARAFLKARTALESPAAAAGLKAAKAGEALEQRHEAEMTAAREAIWQLKPRLGAAILERAGVGFPRDDVRDLLEEARNLAENQEHLRTAFDAGAAGEFGKAERWLTRVQQAAAGPGPLTDAIPIWAASTAMGRGAAERAIDHLQALTNPDARYRLGLALATCGRWLAATAAFRDAGKPDLEACAQLRADARRRETMIRLQQLVASQSAGEAERALDRALAEEPDPVLESIRTRTLEPMRHQASWNRGTGAERLVRARQAIGRDPDAANVHLWFVALDALVDEDSALVPEWLSATVAVVANMAQSLRLGPEAGKIPAAKAKALQAMLIRRAEQRLDLAREQAPELERAWRDHWRVEVGALEARRKRFALPRHNKTYLTPGLWERTEARPPRPGEVSMGTPLARLLPVLYTPWAAVAGAILAEDMDRAALVAPQTDERPDDASRLGRNLWELARGLRLVATGDAAGWEHVAAGKPGWEAAIQLRQRIDDAAHAHTRDWKADEFADLPKAVIDSRDKFLTAWKQQLATPRAQHGWVSFRVSELVFQLNGKRIKPADAKKRLEGWLQDVPDHDNAKHVLRQVQRTLSETELNAALKRGNVDQAVQIAVRSGDDAIRINLAGILMGALSENFGKISFEEVAQTLRWVSRLTPQDPDLRELAKKLGVSL